MRIVPPPVRRYTAAALQALLGTTAAPFVDATNFRLGVLDGTTPGGRPAAGFGDLFGRNALINGNFAVNQRGFASGTALAAGAYGHDRWKAGSGGCTYTFNQAVPDTPATITAGSLVQIVEGGNIAAATMWLTWTGTAAARVYQSSAPSQASPAYAAGSAATIGGIAVNVLAVSGLTVGGNASVEFATGSVGLVQLEVALPGAGPRRFERRQPGQELALCQRYFQRWAPPPLRGVAGSATSCSRLGMPLGITMRAAPTVTMNGSLKCFNGSSAAQIASISTSYSSPILCEVDATLATGANYAAGNIVVVYNNADGASLDLSAEL